MILVVQPGSAFAEVVLENNPVNYTINSVTPQVWVEIQRGGARNIIRAYVDPVMPEPITIDIDFIY